MYARIPTDSTDNTVTRTVARKIVEDLKANLAIDNSAIIALENLFEDKTYKTGLNASIEGSIIENPIIERLEVSITDNILNEYNTGRLTNDKKPLYRNRHISIDTEFINMQMSIAIKYYSKSKVNADRLIKQLRDLHLTRGEGYVHAVDYFYNVPGVLLGLLESIFTTAKINYDDGTNFIEFLRDGNIINALTIRGNNAGEKPGLAVLAQNKIRGVFDVDFNKLKPELDRDTGNYTIDVVYNIDYMMPEALIIDFETLVNNTSLPTKYFIEQTVHGYDGRRIKDEIFADKYTLLEYKQNYVAIPPFDNHKPMVAESTTIKPVFSVLVNITPTDLRSLFNLKDLGNYNLTDTVISYMEANYQYLNSKLRNLSGSLGYDSIFVLDLYKDNQLQNRYMLEVDADLNVSTNVDLDIKSVYRVVLSMMIDINMLSAEGKTTVENTISNDDLTKLLSSVTNDTRQVDVDLPRYMIPFSPYQQKTVQVSIIQTFFKE